MLAAARHRFTVEEYHRMAETGVFRPEARVELLNGEIFDMPPLTPFRSGVVSRLTRLLTNLSKDRWLVWTRGPVTLDGQSQIHPDIALLKPIPGDYTSRFPLATDVLLLIEVCENASPDVQQRLATFARTSIPEVWQIHLHETAIELHRRPQSGVYGPKTVVGPDAQARPLAFPDVIIDVATLLQRAAPDPKTPPATAPKPSSPTPIPAGSASQFYERHRAEADKAAAYKPKPPPEPSQPAVPLPSPQRPPDPASIDHIRDRYRAEIAKAASAKAQPEPALDQKTLDVLTLLCGSANELSPLQIAMNLRLSPEMAEKYIDELLRRRFIAQSRGAGAGSGSGQTTFQVRPEGRKYVDENTWNP
jgi:Uma2 family endonuclease